MGAGTLDPNEILQSIVELRESQRKTDELVRRVSRDVGGLNNKWGLLVEALLEPGTLELFRQRGIPVNRSSRRVEFSGGEIDLLLKDKETLIAVEIKSTCKTDHIDWLLEQLPRFHADNPEYRDWKLQGAVAALQFESGADRHAYRNGLWVLRCREGIVEIANDEKFQPRLF